jgi:hypothetical protein
MICSYSWDHKKKWGEPYVEDLQLEFHCTWKGKIHNRMEKTSIEVSEFVIFTCYYQGDKIKDMTV